MGEFQPVTGNTCDNVKPRAALIDCPAPDRRAYIEVKGVKDVVNPQPAGLLRSDKTRVAGFCPGLGDNAFQRYFAHNACKSCLTWSFCGYISLYAPRLLSVALSFPDNVLPRRCKARQTPPDHKTLNR